MEIMFGKPTKNSSYLTDKFGRVHNYLRLSITENCNFGCSYCMPHTKQSRENSISMTASEIVGIAEYFFGMGVDKIRLTGGEPLIRSDISEIISKLGKLPIQLAITTNGSLLHNYLAPLKKANFNSINISIDSLQPGRFKEITGSGGFNQVYSNIFKAIDAGFSVKLNVVVMKGLNEDEIVDFGELTLHNPITIRFIEFMPFPDNNWSYSKIIKQDEILKQLKTGFSINELETSFESTAQYYQISGAKGKIGVISSISNPFCDSCNRIRITSDGKLKSCLFGHSEYDLLTHLRSGKALSLLIQEALSKKSLKQGGKKTLKDNINDIDGNRNMHSIGG